MGFSGFDSRFRVLGFGFRHLKPILAVGFGFRVSADPREAKSYKSRFWVSGFGFRVSQFETKFSSRFRVSGFVFRVSIGPVGKSSLQSRFRVSRVETSSADLSPDHVSFIVDLPIKNCDFP